jgi:hypothetical protein
MAKHAIGGKIRVWEVAKLADTDSNTVWSYLELIGQGHTIKSASSSIPTIMGEAIVARLRAQSEGE